MSKKIQYPDGYVGVVSDAVAEILGQRKGHKILAEKPEPPKPFEAKPKADK